MHQNTVSLNGNQPATAETQPNYLVYLTALDEYVSAANIEEALGFTRDYIEGCDDTGDGLGAVEPGAITLHRVAGSH